MKTFWIQPKIYYGSNSLDYLNELDAKKVLLITDKYTIHLNAEEEVINRLKSASVKVFSEIEDASSLAVVKKGLACFLQEDPDLMVALGGTAAIDAAKAIRFFCHQPAVHGSRKKLPFVVIPTTSGTGSEVTPYSVITGGEDNERMPLHDERMLPDAVILNAQLTVVTSPSVTADTGMDLLTHAIESYVSLEATEFTTLFSEKAIKLVFTHLLRAYRFGEDLTARESLQLASCMAGFAFVNSSLGVNHSIAHAMEAEFPLSHGRINAMLLPYIIEYNGGLCDGTLHSSEAAKKYMNIANMLGLPCSTVEEGIRSLSTAVKLLNKKFNIPLTFQDSLIEKNTFEKSIPLIAKKAPQDVCTAGNPKQVKEMDLVYLLKWAYTG
ncbi:1-propanol dehydrogenase PduQ [Pseudobacillus sp. 179-B 2D1 NHS]|uniref:1-propanol dehydrogenase PduQ n=1 Tax=Pseudobacillus sp. 179-B 2D1 NHS TaxID=3374292 RepID=UPI00387904CA